MRQWMRLLAVVVIAVAIAATVPSVAGAIQERWSKVRLTHEVKKLKKQNRRQAVRISELRTSLSDLGQIVYGLDMVRKERDQEILACVYLPEEQEAACVEDALD